MKDAQGKHEFIKTNYIILFGVKKLKHLQHGQYGIRTLSSHCGMFVRTRWASASERVCLYLLCKDIAVILSFEKGICKLILVNYAILHSRSSLTYSCSCAGTSYKIRKQQVYILKLQNAIVQHYCYTLWMLLLRSLNNSSRAYTSSTLTAQAKAVRGGLQPASRDFTFLTVCLRS